MATKKNTSKTIETLIHEEAKRKKRGTSWFGRSNRIEVAPVYTFVSGT
jgi:hypothetical protein